MPAVSVHPRGRGERSHSSSGYRYRYGSSPRARGTRSRPRDLASVRRFIPAGAGNARHRDAANRVAAVHPRGRGERSARADRTEKTTGSSPRARGTPDPSVTEATKARFIPAGAGNALVPPLPPGAPPVHPRGRGERLFSVALLALQRGSSPRARGTRYGRPCARSSVRFIPAGAGNASMTM